MELRSKFELQQQFLEEARAAQSASTSSSRLVSRRGNNSPNNAMLSNVGNLLLSPHSRQELLTTTTTSSSPSSLNSANMKMGNRTGNVMINNNNNNNNNNSSSNSTAEMTWEGYKREYNTTIGSSNDNAKINSSSNNKDNTDVDLSTPFMPSTALPDDPTALVREVPGAENIKALNEAAEHAYAVQRYMEKENLSLEESAKYIMANGSTGQKISFFGHVRESLEGADQKLMSKIMSTLLECMWTQDPELQCQAPEDVINLINLMSSTVAMQVLEVTETMLTVKTSAIRIEWNKLLLKLIACLSLEQIEKKIIPLAISKGDHAQPQDQRELSCDILGRACEFLNKDKVEELVVPRAHTLCCDTNVGVRERMCNQLVTIAHALGVERAKEAIAEDLFELLNDEERVVSRAAFSCLIDLVEFFGPEYRKRRLYPIIKIYIEKPPREMIGLLTAEFGRFLHEIKADIDTSEDVELFASFYVAACNRQEDEARRQCAFYLPAVVASLPMEIFATHLSRCLNSLANDKTIPVRRCIAAGLHELVPLLSDTAAVQLEKSFLSLLHDDDRGVLSLLFKNIDILLDCFVVQYDGNTRCSFFKAVSETLLRLHSRVHTHWRSMRSILHVLHHYQAYIRESVLTDYFTPVVLEYAVKGASVLKAECVQLVVDFMQRCSSVQVRVHLLTRLNNEFAKSDSCYRRECYLRFVQAFSTVFSHRSLRERLLETALELHKDPVTRIRVALARVLPHLATCLQFKKVNNINNNSNTSANTPSSMNAIVERFNDVVKRMCMDEDEEVRTTTRESMEEIEQMERKLNLDNRLREQLEEADYRREKDELSMLEWAKEFDKLERRAKLRDMLKLERNRELTETNNINSVGLGNISNTISSNNSSSNNSSITGTGGGGNSSYAGGVGVCSGNINSIFAVNITGNNSTYNNNNSNNNNNNNSNSGSSSSSSNVARKTGTHGIINVLVGSSSASTPPSSSTPSSVLSRRRSAGGANSLNNNTFMPVGSFNSYGANVATNTTFVGLSSANSVSNINPTLLNVMGGSNINNNNTNNATNYTNNTSITGSGNNSNNTNNSNNNNSVNTSHSPSHHLNDTNTTSPNVSDLGNNSSSNNNSVNSSTNAHSHASGISPKKQTSPMALPRINANTQTRSSTSTTTSSGGPAGRTHGLHLTTSQPSSKPRSTALRQHLHGLHSHLGTSLPSVNRKR